MKTISSIVIVATLLISCNRESREQHNDDLITIGKKIKVHSNVLNEDREIWISVPQYDPKSDKKFPVLYLLDGDTHFESVTGLINIMGSANSLMPEMIVVAIPNTDRTRDLTPTHSLTMSNGEEQEFLKTSGGGSNFLKFIQTELIPNIEATFPTNPYRVLVGHSFGGITTINALYTMPETFDAYIAIDPSFWWDNVVLVKKADSVFSTKDFKNKYLYISQANTLQNGETTNPHFAAIKTYKTLLESPSNKSRIRWAYDYYPDDSHGSVPFISEYDGLRFIFKDFNPRYEKFKMNPDSLQANFSQYHMAPPEFIVNNFGYTAMNQKDLALAERFFQMNIDAYPKSWNVYDSMGELLLNKGDTAQAVKMYERSIVLNPENENGKKVVSQLMARKK